MSSVMLILVVEDEPISALSAMWELQRAGHEVIGPASSSEDALRLARERQPDLALVDIDLRHVGEGVGVARDLRDLRVAAVFVTAQSRVAEDNCDVALGLISKPYTLAELVVSVDVIDSVLHDDVPPPRSIPRALRLFN